ncbi:uncharacterized protein [Palaemon carinicauda]|uniref:uncharacterized protein n=1 Tax=Palaemon carinicauda TaxID=392227 RepID=UPI0035B5895D
MRGSSETVAMVGRRSKGAPPTSQHFTRSRASQSATGKNPPVQGSQPALRTVITSPDAVSVNMVGNEEQGGESPTSNRTNHSLDRVTALEKQLEVQQSLMTQLVEAVVKITKTLEDKQEKEKNQEANLTENNLEKDKAEGSNPNNHGNVAQVTPDLASYIRAQIARNSVEASKPVQSTPYPAYVEAIILPEGHPSTFTLFNGSGSPREHLGRFIAQCGKTASNPNMLLKQFKFSLTGPAFMWWCKLPAGSIENWDQLEDMFIQAFCTTERTVSITELAAMKQKDTETTNRFITRWKNEAIYCPQALEENQKVQMCYRNMHYHIHKNFLISPPTSFQELVTKAHDIEQAYNMFEKKSTATKVQNTQRDRAAKKETHSVEADDKKRRKPAEVPPDAKKSKTGGTQRPSYKEKLNKKYPFPNDQVETILDQVLFNKHLELPEPKRPEEVGQVNDPKYCKWHQMVGHKTSDCWILKDKFEALIKDGIITVEAEDGRVTANMITFGKFDPTPIHPFSPIKVEAPPLQNPVGSYLTEEGSSGWKLCVGRHTKKLIHKEIQKINQDELVKRIKKPKPRKLVHKEYHGPEVRTLGDFLIPKLTEAREEKALSLVVITPRKDISQTLDSVINPEADAVRTRSGKTLHEVIVPLEPAQDQETQLQEPPAPSKKNDCEPAKMQMGNQKRSFQSLLGKIKYDVISHLKKIPALLSVYDALIMSEDLRKSLILALENPELYVNQIGQYEEALATVSFDDSEMSRIRPHIRPLYVKGRVANKNLNRILIDCGSSVNLMSLKTLFKLGYTHEQLSPSSLVVHGFDHSGQKPLGTIVLDIDFGELVTPTKLYVLNVNTTYRILLGRPWIHENKIIPSSLCQCFKFLHNGTVKRVEADPNPFPGEESYLADARYYKESFTFEKGESSNASKIGPTRIYISQRGFTPRPTKIICRKEKAHIVVSPTPTRIFIQKKEGAKLKKVGEGEYELINGQLGKSPVRFTMPRVEISEGTPIDPGKIWTSGSPYDGKNGI